VNPASRVIRGLIEVVLWSSLAYLTFRATERIGSGAPYLIAALTVVGTIVALGQSARALAPERVPAAESEPPGSSVGHLFGRWLPRLFVLAMTLAFAIWDVHAIRAGVTELKGSPSAGWLASAGFLLVCLWMMLTMRACALQTAEREDAP